MTDDDPAFHEVCAHCGAELGLDEWPPVVAAIDDGSETACYSFCDDDCEAAWRRRSNPPTDRS